MLNSKGYECEKLKKSFARLNLGFFNKKKKSKENKKPKCTNKKKKKKRFQSL